MQSPATSPADPAPVVTDESSVASEDETHPDATTANDASPRFDVSETEARRLCEYEAEEDVRVERCAFGVGQDLPGGARVDLLELVYSEMVSVSVAMLIIRTPEDIEFPITFTLAEAMEGPGMEEAYTLGTMSVSGTQITDARRATSADNVDNAA